MHIAVHHRTIDTSSHTDMSTCRPTCCNVQRGRRLSQSTVVNTPRATVFSRWPRQRKCLCMRLCLRVGLASIPIGYLVGAACA